MGKIMKKVLLIGGTGGLGIQLSEYLKSEYECVSIGSKDCDVTNDGAVENLFNIHTDVDIIIYLSVKNIDGLVHKQTSNSVNEQLNVNLNGFLNILRYSTQKMRDRGFGRVIYISSVLSKKPIRGTGIYSASKAFCDSIIKTYSLENSKYGITSNSIQLGYFEGGLTEKVPTDILQNVKNSISLKRLGRVEEMAKLVKTIIETEYINGTTISITGGYENE
jgi:NAD(P)-dependent dehydrogenase (short-subunit alcohol dehydrogenase family)